MGKRSTFDRVPRDFYPTPREAVGPLLPHLAPGTQYVEPCAGDGALVRHLALAGHICRSASDIEPRDPSVHEGCYSQIYPAVTVITNPPWTRPILHGIIGRYAPWVPTWLLFDADWPHTRQAAPFLPMLRKIVSVGRVKWIPDSKMTGKDNCCWYLFDAKATGPAQFVGRA